MERERRRARVRMRAREREGGMHRGRFPCANSGPRYAQPLGLDWAGVGSWGFNPGPLGGRQELESPSPPLPPGVYNERKLRLGARLSDQTKAL